MKKLLPFLKPYTKESIISPLFKLFEAGFDLLVPIVVKRMMDEGIPAGDRAQIWRLCGVLVLFALAGIACSLTAQYFAARAAVGFGAGLRSALFRQIQIGAGALVLLGILGSWAWHPMFWLSVFVGAGLVFAGVTGFCGLGLLLARMPWNKR